MKILCSILIWFCVGTAAAADQADEPPMPAIQGEVLEIRDVESYSYLRLKTSDGEIWAAVAKVPVRKGAQVTIEDPLLMTNFESKMLKKTFDKVVFGTVLQK